MKQHSRQFDFHPNCQHCRNLLAALKSHLGSPPVTELEPYSVTISDGTTHEIWVPTGGPEPQTRSASTKMAWSPSTTTSPDKRKNLTLPAESWQLRVLAVMVEAATGRRVERVGWYLTNSQELEVQTLQSVQNDDTRAAIALTQSRIAEASTAERLGTWNPTCDGITAVSIAQRVQTAHSGSRSMTFCHTG